jgi:small multidrug resistance family-3 protein
MIESLASNLIIVAVGLFFVIALTEIGGGYLLWQWIREKKGIIFSISKAK